MMEIELYFPGKPHKKRQGTSQTKNAVDVCGIRLHYSVMNAPLFVGKCLAHSPCLLFT